MSDAYERGFSDAQGAKDGHLPGCPFLDEASVREWERGVISFCETIWEDGSYDCAWERGAKAAAGSGLAFAPKNPYPDDARNARRHVSWADGWRYVLTRRRLTAHRNSGGNWCPWLAAFTGTADAPPSCAGTPAKREEWEAGKNDREQLARIEGEPEILLSPGDEIEADPRVKELAKFGIIITESDGGEYPFDWHIDGKFVYGDAHENAGEADQTFETLDEAVENAKECAYYAARHHFATTIRIHMRDKHGNAMLFKAVDDDWSTDRARRVGITYAPGQLPVAADWDGGKVECGAGLHASPHPRMAQVFNRTAKKFVCCPVALSEIAVHPNGSYPEKVKFRGCAAPTFAVDVKGKPVEVPA